MKNSIKMISRIICLILAMVMSMAVIGCGGESSSVDTTGNTTSTGSTDSNNTNDNYDNGEGTNEEEDDGKNVIDTDDYESSEPDGLDHFGTHIYTAPESADKWLVKDGVTQYKLVVPSVIKEASREYYDRARNEFVEFFHKATGITIEVVQDIALPETTHSANQHYISLGETTLLQSLNGAIDYSEEECTLRGGKIVTVDNNVYLAANTLMGVQNMVYTFLSVTFNWETYSANTVVIDQGIKNMKLREYAVHDIPDTHYTPTSAYEKSSFALGGDYSFHYEHTTNDANLYGNRVRAYTQESLQVSEVFEGLPEDIDVSEYAALNKPSGHNSTRVLNYDKWKDIHPEWYAPNGAQLCYTAHGNQEKYDLMVDYLARTCERALLEYPVAKYPHKNYAYITMSDDMNMCTCDACVEGRAKYQNSGLVVKLFNEVAKKVEEWMNRPGNEAYKRDNFKIVYYAYYACETPPAKINAETGEWEPVDETVIMHKNTLVYYAPIACDFQQSLFASDNKWSKDNFDGWAAVANGSIGYFMYNYNCNYHNYFYDAFDHYNTKGMNYYLSHGRVFYYAENIHGTVPTEWGALISYMSAKLCYDSTLDSGKIISDWFNAVYGPAAGVMMDMFNQIRLFTHNETVRNDFYIRRSNRARVKENFDWRPEVIFNWVDTADAALRLIEPLKQTNPAEYDRIAYNIELEVFSPIYILYTDGANISAERDAAIKKRFNDNLVKYPEYKYISAESKTITAWLETI